VGARVASAGTEVVLFQEMAGRALLHQSLVLRLRVAVAVAAQVDIVVAGAGWLLVVVGLGVVPSPAGLEQPTQAVVAAGVAMGQTAAMADPVLSSFGIRFDCGVGGDPCHPPP
jgi:hypothetical protein